ncbi:MAG TPA: iron-containing alcohol dehydrogenase [Burkholderiales bacterium]|nr:iron-containing alcohol dehydrogenase [Burkholderiales bacterium]
MKLDAISYLNDVYFARGALGVLPELLARLGIEKPLVVTDAGLVGLGIVRRLGISDVFDGTETNPTEGNLRSCLALYRSCGCDGLVAFGGGASIDLAKLVAMMAGHEPPLEQYAVLNQGISRIKSGGPLLVAVPTTAGSGSEVGRAALLKLDSGRKLGFLSPHLLPKAAVCDAVLTASMPPALTAATGMDAISHCVEACCSSRKNPVAEAIALEGLARGWRAIRRAHADGADLEAREDMMLCALMGGLAFQKGLGAVHSLSHPLGGLDLRLHHGTLNALFLPPVLRFNQQSCAREMERLAGAIGVRSGQEVPDAFERLLGELGLPRRLRDMGVTKAALAPLAAQAAEDHCTATNPRRFDEQAAKRLYEEAFE